MRYKADPEPFEWLRSYAELKSWIGEATGHNTSASSWVADGRLADGGVSTLDSRLVRC